jgi:hypothetical protein
MQNNTVRLEFPRKSKSVRRKIFVNRTRKTIRALATAFYEKSGVEVPAATVDAVTDSIVDDIMSTIATKPDFARKILDPEVTNRDALMEKLYRDVLTAARGDNEPFAFVKNDGPEKREQGNAGCGKKRKRKASA